MTTYGYSGSSSSPSERFNATGIVAATCIVLLTFVAGCAGVNPDETKTASSDRLQTSTGVVVDVPREGALRFNAKAAELAGQIKQLDAALEGRWSPPGRMDPALAAEVLRIVKDSRDGAVEDLALAYRIADRTSGPLDTGIVSRAQENVNYLRQALAAPAASFKLNVITFISADVGGSIHYVSAAEAEQSSTPDWQSYTKGQPLRIGRYEFRVQPSDGSQRPFTEMVPILTDPFTRELKRSGI